MAWWHPRAASHLPKSWHWGLLLLQLMSARLQGRQWGWQSCCCWSSVKTLLSEIHELNSSQHLPSHVNRNQSSRVTQLKYSLCKEVFSFFFFSVILITILVGHKVKWWLQEIKKYEVSLKSEDGIWKFVHNPTPLETVVNSPLEWHTPFLGFCPRHTGHTGPNYTLTWTGEYAEGTAGCSESIGTTWCVLSSASCSS